MELDWTIPRIIEHQWELNEQTHDFQREFPAFSAVFAPFSSIGCISKSRFTGRSDRLLDILKFARLFRIVQRLVCLRMVFFTSPRGPHLVGRGHAQVTCLQFLEKNPLYFSIRSRKCNNPIELSWWFFKTKNWLPIVSGFRIGWAFIFGSCGCSSHTHSDGPKGINHHWTSSKQASSPSSRPLKAMRPQKKQRQRTCLPFQKPVLCPSTPPTSSTYLTTTSPFWVPSPHFWRRPMTPGCFGHCTASCGAISCDRTTAWHNSCITRGAMWVTTPVTLW